MFVMAKKIKEFASTLNGIAASVRCVSSMLVVPTAKFKRLVAAKNTVRNKQSEKSAVYCSVLEAVYNTLLYC